MIDITVLSYITNKLHCFIDWYNTYNTENTSTTTATSVSVKVLKQFYTCPFLDINLTMSMKYVHTHVSNSGDAYPI